MLDMGVAPFLLASTFRLVVAQRLVRRICPSCREAISDPNAAAEVLRKGAAYSEADRVLLQGGTLGQADANLTGVRLLRGGGCDQCNGSGYRGRIGIFEALEIDDEIRQMILDQRDAAAIRAAAIRRGMKTMFDDGLAKVFQGETTLDEVVRVTV
jgi:type II secretory ATPase GspE/PulE/Tfp pilus assembly ATPase PilB-like protein